MYKTPSSHGPRHPQSASPGWLQQVGFLHHLSQLLALCSWTNTFTAQNWLPNFLFRYKHTRGVGARGGFIRFLRCWHCSKPKHDPVRLLGQQIPEEEKLHQNKGSLSENRSTKKSPHCFSWKRDMKLFLKLGEALSLAAIPYL